MPFHPLYASDLRFETTSLKSTGLLNVSLVVPFGSEGGLLRFSEELEFC